MIDSLQPDETNEKFYDKRNIRPAEIFKSKLEVSPAVNELKKLLLEYAGK